MAEDKGLWQKAVDALTQTQDKGKGLHGYVADTPINALTDPIVKMLLDPTNKLRYGVTEAERTEMINRLSAPGVEKHAYPKGKEGGEFDPAAAERYTSAYLFGKKWKPGHQTQETLNSLVPGNRELWNKLGVPHVGEERPELVMSTAEGMARGAEEERQVRPDYGLGGAQIKPQPSKTARATNVLRRLIGLDELPEDGS